MACACVATKCSLSTRGRTAAKQPPTDRGFAELLMRGLPIPRYPQLKLGLPARRALVRLWTTHRPDVVHLVTEGPLGWSALQAAAAPEVPVVSDFRTNFHAYSRHYGVAWLRDPIMAYLRKFHNRTACTMVPTETLRTELRASGFRRLRVVSRGVDTRQFDPAGATRRLRSAWGAGAGYGADLCRPPGAGEEPGQPWWPPTRPCANRILTRLVLVGDGPERPGCSSAAPLPSSPACGAVKTWPCTTRRPMSSSSPA
jgi:hypothetical protein